MDQVTAKFMVMSLWNVMSLVEMNGVNEEEQAT
jgi:hypothetical protein